MGLVATLFCAAPAVEAQVCSDPTNTFWKVDTLPDAPVGVPLTSQVIVALCQGEAVGSYFELVPGMGPQYVTQASIGLGHTSGETTHQFIVSVEVYEGSVNFNPSGTIGMGTKIFEGPDMLATTTGMNTFDLTPFNIVVQDDFVVAFRIVANVSFPNCPGAVPGVPANVLTDGTGQCLPGKSLLDERNTGWVDPADWQFSLGQMICPAFYNGNWAVRACTADAGFWDDLGGASTSPLYGDPQLMGAGPLTVGTFNPVSISSVRPNALMLVWFALNPSAPFAAIGGTVHAFPFNSQFFVASNTFGQFSAAASWPPGVPSATEVYFQFIIDDPSSIHDIVISNGIRGTTP